MSVCEHDFKVDLDGQVTCVTCQARDDEMPQWKDPYQEYESQVDFE